MRTWRVGEPVLLEGRRWIILKLDSPEHLILEDPDNGDLKVAGPKDLVRPERVGVGKRKALDEAEPDELASAKKLKRRLDFVAQLPADQRRAGIREIARDFDMSERTVYRRLDRHVKQPRVSTQLRKVRDDKGGSRLPEKAELLITTVLKTHLSKRTGGSVRALVQRMNKELTEAGFAKVSYGLLLDRARKRPTDDKLASTRSGSALREARRPKPGKFALANQGPLFLVQMDHSPLDIILVDDEHRQPINRAYLTIVIDCFSRVVLGFFLTLDSPGMLSAGMALFHAIMPKEEWLRERGFNTDLWPCYGLMRAIHTDNAKEFKGTAMSAFCDDNDIDLLQRRKGLPSDGGIVESGFKTFMHQLAHTTEGTTFANVKSKFDYDSEGNARLTVSEAEQLFAIYILQQYHQLPHSGLGGVPPIKRWREGLIGTAETAGIGVPEVPSDRLRLWVQLLPTEVRTISTAGVEWLYRNYYCEGIRHRAHDMDPEFPSRKRKHQFHYDPRDVSLLWFIDPDTNEVIKIPCADPTRPPISIWQLRAAIKKIRDEGRASVDQHLIYDAIEKSDALKESASAKNKKARREQERAREWEKARKRSAALVEGGAADVVMPANADDDGDFGDLSDLVPKAKVTPWKA